MHHRTDDLMDRRTALLALPLTPLAACTELTGPDPIVQDSGDHIEAVTADIGTLTSGKLQGATATFDLDTSSGTDKVLETPGVIIFHSGKTLMNLGVGLTFLQGLSNEVTVETGSRTGHSIRIFDNDNAQSLIEVSEDSVYYDFMPTEVLRTTDSGETGATEAAWIEHEINGTTYYSRLFTTK